MAGGGGALSKESVKRGAQGKRKKKKRVGFHLDMTPLVDITFLLLTFFMFTTTMASPQTMEMSQPPEAKTTVDVKMSELFDVFLLENDSLYYMHDMELPEPLPFKELRPMAIRKNLDKKNRLITALKVDSSATYDRVVQVLDELNLVEAVLVEEMPKEHTDSTGAPLQRERRFTIAEISEEEFEKLNEVRGIVPEEE